jgi:hypothetical protein
MTSMTLSDAVASGRGGAGSGNLEWADMIEPGMQSFVSQEWAICAFRQLSRRPLPLGRCTSRGLTSQG